MIGPAGTFAAPRAEMSQDEINEVMAGMDEAMGVWATHIEKNAPVCHFTKMEWHMAEEGESWYECRHCGHMKEGSESNG